MDNILMAKLSLKVPKKKKSKKQISEASIKKALKEKHSCYVLITCSEPSVDGLMQVEMSYHGDETLASYLLENARDVPMQRSLVDHSADSF